MRDTPFPLMKYYNSPEWYLSQTLDDEMTDLMRCDDQYYRCYDPTYYPAFDGIDS